MSRKLTKTLAAQVLILLVVVMTSGACSTPPAPPTNPPIEPPISPTSTRKPNIVLEGAEEIENNGTRLIEYHLRVSNWQEFPDDLFEAAPDLPLCWQNTNASRTWVNIYNADSDAYIYGFCGFGQSKNLENIWFSVTKGDMPPTAVYIVLNDRQSNIEYRSNNMSISDVPQPTGKADLLLGEAHIESNDDPNDTWRTYKVVLEISNLGNNADTTGFTVFANYKCPAGETTISDGFVVVEGGYLAANNSFDYKAPFHYGCIASPPTVDVVFTIEYSDGRTQAFAPYQLHFP